MKTISKYIFAMMVSGLVLLPGCKKDDEDSTPALSGKLRITSIPSYVLKGEVYHITASGLYKGSDRADSLVGYRLYNPLKSAYDTLRKEGEKGPAEYDFVVSSDSLDSFSIGVYAYASGYSGSYASGTFTIVNPSLDTLKGSLRRHPFHYEVNTFFFDSRSSDPYYASSDASGAWMLQNLAWDGSGYSYEEAEAMNYIAGRFYNWEEAATACPAGWRLPSDSDFVSLAGTGTAGETISGAAGALKGNVYFNSSAMWPYISSSIGMDNGTFFTAMPWGYLTVSGPQLSFKGYGEMAVFWTSDSPDAETALVRYMRADSNDIFVQAMDKKSFYASVRCVKE